MSYAFAYCLSASAAVSKKAHTYCKIQTPVQAMHNMKIILLSFTPALVSVHGELDRSSAALYITWKLFDSDTNTGS